MLPYGLLQICGNLLAAATVALLRTDSGGVDIALDVRIAVGSKFIEVVQSLGGICNLVELEVKVIVETVGRNSHILQRILPLVHLVGGGHVLRLHDHCDRHVADENGSLQVVLLIEFLQHFLHLLRALPLGRYNECRKAFRLDGLLVLSDLRSAFLERMAVYDYGKGCLAIYRRLLHSLCPEACGKERQQQ